MGKEVKTNAVRILDRNKVDYELKNMSVMTLKTEYQ